MPPLKASEVHVHAQPDHPGCRGWRHRMVDSLQIGLKRQGGPICQDGGRRPLGIRTREHEIVQGALAEVLSAVCEADFLFLCFSYGFRPGRNPHQALAAVHAALMSQRVTWVLDADVRSFFDSVGAVCTTLSGRPALLVRQRAAGALSVLRHAAQLARARRLSAGAAKNLAPLSAPAQSMLAPRRVGLVRCGDGSLPPAGSADHSFLGTATHVTRSAFGKSRVRERRMRGSVRAKPWTSLPAP